MLARVSALCEDASDMTIRHQLLLHNRTRHHSRRPAIDMVFDVGLPTASFYLLRCAHVPQLSALLVATLVAALRVAWVAWRSHRLTLFGVLMLSVYGLGIPLSVVTGDARLLLANNSVSSAVVGIAFLGSLARARPLTLVAYQRLHPEQAAAVATAYTSDQLVRSVFRRSAWAWGLGMLCAAALRLPLIYLLPLDIAVGAATLPGFATMGALTIWSISRVRSLSIGTEPAVEKLDIGPAATPFPGNRKVI
ncbi:hypothetical protein ABIA30_004057 [Mycobacterium sp. MAA66]|uniref:VC0807 family protein n=1 Tax=Mycobacterium sp. MAA66 TaxID=3156297 RepID=UPI003516FA85